MVWWSGEKTRRTLFTISFHSNEKRDEKAQDSSWVVLDVASVLIIKESSSIQFKNTDLDQNHPLETGKTRQRQQRPGVRDKATERERESESEVA